MNRKQKAATVSSLVHEFSSCEAAFILTVKLTAQKTQALKKKLRAANGFMLVAKNTLLRRAAAENPIIAPLVGCFKNQIALVFARSNATGIAAIIKDNGYGAEISVKMGLMDGKPLAASKFAFIASIPSKEVLHAQLCGVLQAPIARLAFVLKAACERTESV